MDGNLAHYNSQGELGGGDRGGGGSVNQRTQVETGGSQQDKGKQKHVSQRQKRSKSEAQHCDVTF
ncbi:hypothetical protein D918_03285 [Trichuris suis]|nr:hypothetical protein D918_03285 [Trichuris suis]